MDATVRHKRNNASAFPFLLGTFICQKRYGSLTDKVIRAAVSDKSCKRGATLLSNILMRCLAKVTKKSEVSAFERELLFCLQGRLYRFNGDFVTSDIT